jgi:hypothetical protein
MIAVSDNPRSPLVCLFKTLRGYVGGNVEPFAFESRAATLDGNLVMLGVTRVMEWEPVPGQPRTFWAKVEAVQ